MIYHYTNEKGLFGILSSKSIWLVSSKEMSDNTDRFYGNLFATIALLKSDDENVKLLREHLSESDILCMNMQSFEVQFYSASFCERKDNDYLWMNYADNNKGVSIGIDEQVLDNYFLSTIKDKYNYLDQDNYIKFVKNNLVEKRKVMYDYPISDFVKITTCLRPDSYSLENNESVYRNWFFLILCVLAGIVKAEKFNEEEELRLLFQNRYSEDYVKDHSMYYLFREEYKNILSALGIDIEKQDVKKRMELKLDSSFNSELIPVIIVGDEYRGNIKKLKNKLIAFGLNSTKIIDRRGNKL